jgi:hypothetical protein
LHIFLFSFSIIQLQSGCWWSLTCMKIDLVLPRCFENSITYYVHWLAFQFSTPLSQKNPNWGNRNSFENFCFFVEFRFHFLGLWIILFRNNLVSIFLYAMRLNVEVKNKNILTIYNDEGNVWLHQCAFAFWFCVLLHVIFLRLVFVFAKMFKATIILLKQ